MVYHVIPIGDHVFIDAFGIVLMFNNVRVRFAPSPSGYLHLGNLFVGKFNSLVNERYNGAMILRIEDTNSVTTNLVHSLSLERLLNSFGVAFNESPMLNGYFGPYHQNERDHIYRFYANVISSMSRSFFCNCSFRRIETLKRVNIALGEAAVYDGKCLKRSLKDGKLRLKVPRFGCFILTGKVMRWSCIDMQVLLVKTKTSFHLANVVDDHLMRISHVIRGKDWVHETPKHVLTYLYLGFSIPKFIHLPLLCSPFGKKLSKRQSQLSLTGLVDVGLLPNSIDSYISSIITDVNRKDKLNFDITKLTRLRLNQRELIQCNRHLLKTINLNGNIFFGNCVDSKRIINLCAQKATLTSDVYHLMQFMFHTKPHGWYCKLSSLQYAILGLVIIKYKQLKTWCIGELEALHLSMSVKLGLALRTFCIMIATVVLGKRDSISLYHGLMIIGKEVAIARMDCYMKQNC